MIRYAVLFGALAGVGAVLLFLVLVVGLVLGVRWLCRQFRDAFTDVEPDEDLDICQAIAALGVTVHRNTHRP